MDRKTTTVLSSDRPARGGKPSSFAPPQLHPQKHQSDWGCTHLDEGTCHPASQMLEGRVPRSILAAQGWFRLGGKRNCQGQDGMESKTLPGPRVETPSPRSEAGSPNSIQAHPGETVCMAGPRPGTASWPGRLRAQRGTGVMGWPVQSPKDWCCLTCGWRRTWGQAGIRCEVPSQGPQACHVSVLLHSNNGPCQEPKPAGGPQSLPG